MVGAAAAYGNQALEVATTVKLARALWIIPISIGTAMLFKQKGVKVKIPYFIFGFIAAMLVATWLLCWASYRLIELPGHKIIKWLQRGGRARPTPMEVTA